MSAKYPTITLAPDRTAFFNRELGVLTSTRYGVMEYTRIPRSGRLRTEVFQTGLVSMCFIRGVNIQLELRFKQDDWPDLMEWITMWWMLGKRGAESAKLSAVA